MTEKEKLETIKNIMIAVSNDAIHMFFNKLMEELYEDETEKNLLDKFLEIATDFVYLHEGTEDFEREIMDRYNEQNPLPVGYKLKSTDAWCAAFITVVALLTGIKNFPCECGCERMRQLIIDKYKPYYATELPNRGDIIFFDRNGKNVASHVGIVTGVSDLWISTIEGNSSDMVNVKSYPIDHATIMGFYTPEF